MDDIKFKWHEIGSALDVPFGELQGLQRKPGPDADRLLKVINLWYTKTPVHATWSVILEAVEGPLVNNLLKGQQIREWLAKEPQFSEYMENRRN